MESLLNVCVTGDQDSAVRVTPINEKKPERYSYGREGLLGQYEGDIAGSASAGRTTRMCKKQSVIISNFDVIKVCLPQVFSPKKIFKDAFTFKNMILRTFLLCNISANSSENSMLMFFFFHFLPKPCR
jgi:hypothetical protein